MHFPPILSAEVVYVHPLEFRMIFVYFRIAPQMLNHTLCLGNFLKKVTYGPVHSEYPPPPRVYLFISLTLRLLSCIMITTPIMTLVDFSLNV